MIAMILSMFLIAWGLSFIVAMRAARTQAGTGVSLTPQFAARAIVPILFGALVLGAVYPTNTWDVFTFMPLMAVVVFYGLFLAMDGTNRFKLPAWLWRMVVAGSGALLLIVLARLLYQPYYHWFGSAYGQIDPWPGDRTPLPAYLTHWGLFLFLILAWLIWETREWMAATPLSALNKLKPYELLIEFAIAAFVVLLMYMLYKGAVISLIALPMAFLAAILLLRPDQSDAKRLVLFMIGTGLALTMTVEFIMLVGDIGRMNVVFKLYLQAWALLSVSAAAAFGWTLPAVPTWKLRWSSIWQFGLAVLVAGAAFFTVTATWDKVHDRMNPDVPHTLDSMTYMKTTPYWDLITMDLSQDYHAIRWMQDNVQGSPVIIEGNCVEYHWCTRFTIYTGLPGVVGWNWHQRQQRGFVEPMLVENRITEITNFYTTTNPLDALAFLKKYNVRYIIVGQVESVYYPGEGLLKFEQYNGVYWYEVFREGQTVIYEVN
jgi:YYY domain-containing protein